MEQFPLISFSLWRGCNMVLNFWKHSSWQDEVLKQGDWRLLGKSETRTKSQWSRHIGLFAVISLIYNSPAPVPGSRFSTCLLQGTSFGITAWLSSPHSLDCRCYASLHSQAWISLSLHSLGIPAVPPHLSNLQLFICLRHSSDGNFRVSQYRNQHPGQRQTHSGLSTNTFGWKNVLVSGWNPRKLSPISDTSTGLFSHHNHGGQGLGYLKQQPERFPSEAQVNHWPGPGNSVALSQYRENGLAM